MQYSVRNRRRLKAPTAATPPIATSPSMPVVPVEPLEPPVDENVRVIVSG